MPFKPSKSLQKLYVKYNAKYFDGRLPHVEVGWDELDENDKDVVLGITLSVQDEDTGATEPYRISISRNVKDWTWTQVQFVLLHEMCHVSVMPFRGHGKKFQNEMKRLAMMDAFKGIW